MAPFAEGALTCSCAYLWPVRAAWTPVININTPLPTRGARSGAYSLRNSACICFAFVPRILSLFSVVFLGAYFSFGLINDCFFCCCCFVVFFTPMGCCLLLHLPLLRTRRLQYKRLNIYQARPPHHATFYRVFTDALMG